MNKIWMFLRKMRIWILVILVLVITYIGYNNMESDDFWGMPISSCVSLLIALIVTYWFTQRNVDERYQKESYLSVITKIQDIVADEKMINIEDSEDVTYILMKKRSLSNNLQILKQYSSRFNVKDEINFIESKIDEYETIIADHRMDIDYLQKSQKDLRRPLELIDGKLSDTMIKIFM